MGAQKSSESSSTSGSAQKWANPYAIGATRSIQGTYDSFQPALQGAVANTQELGSQIGGQFNAGQAQAAQGQQYYGDVLSGKYLNSNPQMGAMISRMQGDVSNGVNSSFNLAGRYGSDAHASGLARELANAESQMLYNDYNSQMGRMDNAAAQVGQQNNQAASLALGAQGQVATMPWAGMSAYSGALGNLFNGGTQKSVSYAPNPIWGAIGSGLGAAAAFASDIRLKKDIVTIGPRPDGLTEIEWTYRFDPTESRYRGVDAAEVAIKRPEAHIANFDGKGHSGVNYALLGTPMVKVAA